MKPIRSWNAIDSVFTGDVIALTRTDEVVMVEQFRHGSNTVELEVPGGMIDAKDTSPVFAGYVGNLPVCQLWQRSVGVNLIMVKARTPRDRLA